MRQKSKKHSEPGPAVSLAGVCKSFGSREVLDSVSFSAAGGEGFCICGANAAGKTTLLKIIAGLLLPGAGKVQICGFDLQEKAPQAKPLLGAVFHKSMVYPQLTVSENLRFFGRLYGVKNGNVRIEELLQQTGLMPCRYDRAGILSRGITQRLAIARAMVHDPAVLLADEPFTGLDCDAAESLVAILEDFKKGGGTIVMATHNVNFALNCCKQVAVLDDRKLIFSAKVSGINTAEFAKDYLLYAKEHC